jgi:hypothetical protein
MNFLKPGLAPGFAFWPERSHDGTGIPSATHAASAPAFLNPSCVS